MSVTDPPRTTVDAAHRGMSARHGGFRVLRDYGVVGCFAMLFVVLAIASQPFLSATNLLNILDQQGPILIMAAAGTLVVIAGGVDLSVGATFALAGVLGAQLANTAGPLIGIVAGFTAGLFVGLVNGLLTTVGRINSLIGTLAVSFTVTGLAVIASQGQVVVVRDPAWSVLGAGRVLGIPYGVLVTIVFVAFCWILLTRTVFGRHVYAVGGNEEAAWLSGVRVTLVRCLVLGLSGLSAGLGGVLIASRVSTGQAGTGLDLMFLVLAGIVIGGTSIMGGTGAVWRSVLGVLFLALIHNGFTLLGLDSVYEQLVQGALIVLAVGIDAWARRRR